MELHPTIFVKNRKSGETGRYRIDQAKILIGREKSCFVVLEGRTVSRRHAEITYEAQRFFLKDLKSGNRTYLNEGSLNPDEKILLNSGDKIRIGDYDLHFSLPSSGDEDLFEGTDSDILEIKMVKKLLKALDRENSPSLEIVEGPQRGKRFVLEGRSQEITIGRDAACEFQIDSDVISRKHARLIRKWDAVQIDDLGSRNGVYVGKKRIKKSVLKDGDRVHLGTVILMFRNPLEVALDLAPPKEAKVKPSPPPKPKVTQEETAPPEEPPPAPEKRPTPKRQPGTSFRLSPFEILIGVIGLTVLVGAIWAILQIL